MTAEAIRNTIKMNGRWKWSCIHSQRNETMEERAS